ncbi:MAG: ATP synthase F1 subunit gamma [Myxococcota bacterium]
MATLQDIRRRISGVEKTQKITRAMKTVSAAKLGRASRAIAAARPYATKIREVLGAVSQGVDPDAHPLLQVRTPVRKLDVVVFSSDRGLCGAFNHNIIKRAEALIVRRQADLESVSLVCVGRKATEYFRRHSYGEVVHHWAGLGAVTQGAAEEIAQLLMSRYEAEASDQVVLVFSEFQSALTQHPTDLALLPLSREEGAQETADGISYEIEPNAESLLRLLVPRAVEFAIFRALLENQAGEHGARMTAMDNATNNTEELIESLTRTFNKARQSAITGELVEIVSGAEAL